MSQTDRSDSGEGSGSVFAIVASDAAENASAPFRSSTPNPSRYAEIPRFDDDDASAIAVVAAYVQSPVSPATIVPDRRDHASPTS